jgi:formyl-CoA transferase
MLLADMGAEVIKVENPQGGDPFRGWDLGGDEPNFWAYNRGKRSVTLNLQTPRARRYFSNSPIKPMSCSTIIDRVS